MDSSDPALLWTPTAAGVREANLTAFMNWLRQERALDFADYESLRHWSVADLQAFWGSIWDYYQVQASTPYTSVLGRNEMPGARWFAGASLNYAEHVLGRAPNLSPAVIAVGEDHRPTEISGSALRGQVGALAAALRSLGVRPGDRVAAYVGNLPEAVVAMLAVTSVGAVWTACAPDFGVRSVLDRFAQVEPSVLIAVDGYRFGGRERERIETIRELRAGLPTVHTTIVVRSLRRDSPALLNALAFDELVAQPREPEFEQVPFDHPLWVLYSSGSTGIPKGIVHGHGGILLEHLKSLAWGWTCAPETGTSSTARRVGWPGTIWSGACCTAPRSSSTTEAPHVPIRLVAGPSRRSPAPAPLEWAPPTSPRARRRPCDRLTAGI
jgi:acetoacetyl-CoA synthetase